MNSSDHSPPAAQDPAAPDNAEQPSSASRTDNLLQQVSKLKLLYRSATCIALYKPAGVNFHSEDGQPGFVVQATQQLQQPLWPVHRLDKVTSGIVLLATSSAAAADLSQQFADHQIEKRYLAISRQKPRKKQGLIIGDMTKSRNGCWKLLRSRDNPAITRFLSHYDDTMSQRLFLLAPQTGRTHQLRVAMKSLSAPIMGDTRYAGESADRTYLHAYAIRFRDQDTVIELLAEPDEPQWGQRPPQWCSATGVFTTKD